MMPDRLVRLRKKVEKARSRTSASGRRARALPNLANLANILMKIIAATDAKNRFGELIDMAQSEPVRVQRQGRDVAVVLSPEEFRRLSRLRWPSLVICWGMSKKHATSRDSKTGQFGGRGRSIGDSGNWQKRDERSGRFTVGSEGMSKLNAIEGIKQSHDSRKMFADFERNGVSAEERRRAIVEKHTKKG